MIAQPPDNMRQPEVERLQTFASKNGKFGVARDPDGQNLRPVVLRSYKDARAAKNRVAKKQRKINAKKK